MSKDDILYGCVVILPHEIHPDAQKMMDEMNEEDARYWAYRKRHDFYENIVFGIKVALILALPFAAWFAIGISVGAFNG